MNVLDNLQIESILKDNKVKINGIYPKNMIPRDEAIGWTIVNMQDSTDGGGTHWVCFYKSPFISLYFDSFGMVAPLEIEDSIGKYIYNKKQIQDIEDSSCGYYCIACICNVRDLSSFENFLGKFKSPKENVKLLNAFFTKN